MKGKWLFASIFFYYALSGKAVTEVICDRGGPPSPPWAAAKSEAISVPVCSGVIDRNYAPPSLHECDEEWRHGLPRGGGRKEHPNSFDSSMRAIHDVSSGSLHAGVMKAFLRGSTRANWPSWINRGGGAERIHQTSPHLCESVEGAPRSGITSQRIKHVRSAFSLTSRRRPASSSRRYPHFIPLSWLPTYRHPLQIYLPICPRLCPHLRLLIHCPASGSIERLSVTGGGATACPDCTPTSC